MKMNISEVRIYLVKNDSSKIKARASITIDGCFVVHDIKVMDGEEGLYIRMPNRKSQDGKYKDIAHPLDTETREGLKELVLKAFEEEKKKDI